MSVKSFISAELHLAKLGFTVQEALTFINSYLAQPDFIFGIARQYGVTANMLSEISGHSKDVVREYFDAAGLVSKQLDYTSMLVNSDLSTLEHLVSFNSNTGILSNDSLISETQPLTHVDPVEFDDFFQPVYPDHQSNDGIFDAEELGVGHLNNVSATSESIKSLFYGSLINMYSALDETELGQINAFPRNDDPEGFQALLLSVLSESPTSIVWTEENLAEMVEIEAAHIIDEYYESVNGLVGLLDHSFLGLATI